MTKFEQLNQIVKKLRGPDGCDWDRKQTHESLMPYLLEEVYEVIEAIETKDFDLLKEELGDLLLHVVFQADLAEEKNNFSIEDSIERVNKKLISRHPHIFDNKNNTTWAKGNWESQKQKEKKRDSILEGVPNSLPAMVKATRMQEKARGVGFDWDNQQQVWDKVNEELQEFKVEVDAKSDNMEAELGDVLFSIINYARFIGVNPEDALEKTNKKFITRFQYLETESAKDGKVMGEMTLAEMDKYWERAKTI